MQEIFALEGCQMNYVKYLDFINYGKQATAFTENLVYRGGSSFLNWGGPNAEIFLSGLRKR